MDNIFLRIVKQTDWFLFSLIIALIIISLLTIKSFDEVSDYFFSRQLIWVGLSIFVFIALQFINLKFLENSFALLIIYSFGLVLLTLLFFVSQDKTASWLKLPFFSFEPSEPMKLMVILVLAKYLAKRHIEIANFKHILISGSYAVIPFLLVFFQPDFGSSLVFFFIWLGLMISSEISKKHLVLLLFILVLSALLSWNFLLKPYQKQRVASFLNPYLDTQGQGYHRLQSMIAIGSGGILGKGIGEGNQTRLKFLPEYQTDFIFASIGEEWGFFGINIVLIFYILILWQILKQAAEGKNNFVRLFALGFGFFIMSHIFIHIGVNLGILPVTGVPLPFLSYGGSHLLTLFIGLGIWQNFKRDKTIL